MQVTMPKLGESVTEGTIGKFLKQPGDTIERYEAIVEVVTDKVNAEVPAPVDGVLAAWLVQEGDTLPVGAAICDITVQGEAAATSAPEAAAPKVLAAPEPELPPQSGGQVPMKTVPAGHSDRPRSSPYVRRLAKEQGISLTQVPGTGPSGRVLRDDLKAFQQRAASFVSAAPAPVEQAPIEVTLQPGDVRVALTPMRKAIAEHMVRSKRTSPHATTWFEVDVSGLVGLRQRVKQAFVDREGVALTYLPFVIKAAIDSLKEYPQLNAVFAGDAIILRHAINVGVAVSVEGGLVVPVLKQASDLSLTGIAKAVATLIARARSGTLSLAELEGGTFTVNNPGAFGSVLSTPIISQPQTAILSMEAIVKRACVVGDAIAIRSMMNLSLSIDHRALDGAMANQFLSAVKRRLEAIKPDDTP